VYISMVTFTPDGCPADRLFIIVGMEVQAYRARRPKLSPLWGN